MCPFTINLVNSFNQPQKSTRMIGEFHDYLIKNGKAVTVMRGIQTENINSCTAGVLKAGDKHFMFHAAPEMQPLGSIKQELEKQVMNLRRICDEVHGFICGGWQLDNRDKSTVQSFDLYNKIADSLDELGVKFTMVCGKEKNAPLDDLYSQGDKVVLSNKGFNIDKNKKLSQDDIISALEDKYQIVEKADEDIFKLGG